MEKKKLEAAEQISIMGMEWESSRLEMVKLKTQKE
jgi:hypothetical protein